VRFDNLTTGYFETREFALSVSDPLAVTPDSWTISSVWSVPLDPPLFTSFEITNRASTPLSYHVDYDVDWIVLNDGTEAGGVLSPAGDPLGGDGVDVLVTTTDDVDLLDPGAYTATLKFTNLTAGSEVTREVELTVEDALAILPENVPDSPDFRWVGPVGGPFLPAAPPTSYQAVNQGEVSFLYLISSDVDWLDINGAATFSDTLLPEFAQVVILEVNVAADLLNAGNHEATVSFADLTSGHTQFRTVSLFVEGELSITPLGEFTAVGKEGGPFSPPTQTLTLANGAPSSTSLTWTAYTTNPPVDWLRIDGQLSTPPAELGGGVSVEVVVSVDALAASRLAPGVHVTTLAFDDGVIPVPRSVRLSVVDSLVQPTERWVSATDPRTPSL